MTLIHNWSRSTEAPGLGGEVELPAGSYRIVADMPVALQHRIAYEPAITEIRFGEQHGEHRRQHEVEITPARSIWAAVAFDDEGNFTVTEPDTYRLTYPHGGKGHVTLTSTNEVDHVSEPA